LDKIITIYSKFPEDNECQKLSQCHLTYLLKENIKGAFLQKYNKQVNSPVAQYLSTWSWYIKASECSWSTQCLKMEATFIFMITLATVDQFSYFFTVKFSKDLWRMLEWKPAPNLLPHYLVKRRLSTIQLYIHISKNNMLHVRWHLFHEFLFVFIFIFSFWY